MVCVDNTMFLAELARLYTAAVDGPRGSVWVTFKRLTRAPATRTGSSAASGAAASSGAGGAGAGAASAAGGSSQSGAGGAGAGAASSRHAHAGGHDENKCLVRATNGHKKVSTIVAAKDVPRFHQLLSEVMRPGMATLKKRERRRQKNAAE